VTVEGNSHFAFLPKTSIGGSDLSANNTNLFATQKRCSLINALKRTKTYLTPELYTKLIILAKVAQKVKDDFG
ncbi:MAG: hypothetical protein ACK45T_06380, partial [Pseudanabaena sp.]